MKRTPCKPHRTLARSSSLTFLGEADNDCECNELVGTERAPTLLKSIARAMVLPPPPPVPPPRLTGVDRADPGEDAGRGIGA